MNVLLGLGIFWTLYGVAGLLGFQIIPKKYRHHDWTAQFIRYRGISWLMIGIPWLILYFLICGRDVGSTAFYLLVLLCALPSIVYTFVNDQKYKDLLKNSEENKF